MASAYQALSGFPLDGMFGAIGSLVDLVTKSLPSDELQLARFKDRYPKRYARIQNSLYMDNYRFLRRPRHKSVTIEDRVNLINGNLPESERKIMINMLHSALDEHRKKDKE